MASRLAYLSESVAYSRMEDIFARPDLSAGKKRQFHALLGGLVSLCALLGMAALFLHFKYLPDKHLENEVKKTWKFVHKIFGYTTLGLVVLQSVTGLGKHLRRKFLPRAISRLHGRIGNFLYYVGFLTVLSSLLFWQKYERTQYIFFILYIFSLVLKLHDTFSPCDEPLLV